MADGIFHEIFSGRALRSVYGLGRRVLGRLAGPGLLLLCLYTLLQHVIIVTVTAGLPRW